MTDSNHLPQETNWSDFIDSLRRFDPPTPRLARRQRALEAQSNAKASGTGDGGLWWQPKDGDRAKR